MSSYRIPKTVAAGLLGFTFAVASLFVAAFPAPAKAASISNACPIDWRPYIELVATVEKAMTEPPLILFTDDAGKVHDCLGKGISQTDLEKLSIVSRDIARVILETKSLDPSGFATNQCSTSTDTLFRDFPYTSINLPLDEVLLGNPMCRKRIENSLSRMVSKP